MQMQRVVRNKYVYLTYFVSMIEGLENDVNNQVIYCIEKTI
jgi:hypothetical protein